MPELPEVETVCRGLAKSLIGKRVNGVEQFRKDIRTPIPRNLAARLMGQKVTAVTRRAKYIQIFLDGGNVLLLHLGMSGRLLITPEAVPAVKHDHLIFHFEDPSAVTVATPLSRRASQGAQNSRAKKNSGEAHVKFNDPRRFGGCDLTTVAELPNHKWLKQLGIEPLGKDLTAEWLKQKFKGKATSIKTALMDQHMIVGIGNIYVAESLFLAGINPLKKAGACTFEQFKKLVPAIRGVLKAAIAAGGSSLRDYRQASGELGYFQHHFAVYGREGERCTGCTCDVVKTGGIKRITQGGRSTFYCKTRQL